MKELKQYNVSTRSARNPCVKVVDIGDDYTDENILKNCILKQNSYLMHDQFDMKIRTVKKMKHNFMAIIECDPVTFNRVMENSRLSVGWSVCRVFEYVNLLRCFNCGGFNHKAGDCKSAVTCATCKSTEHKTEECEKFGKKCGNCMLANDRLDLGLDINHLVFDLECPCYQKQILRERQHIRYLQEST